MSRSELDVAEVFRQFGPAYRQQHGPTMSPVHLRVMRAIETCRTAALGGHVDQCDHCRHREISYNSCRNRHCPKCQGIARAKWIEARCSELLPVPYFHVVFTLPNLLAPLALQNKRRLYDLLFQAASETLKTIASDPKHLGARIGFLAILHTWGQNLLHHPHLHCIVPGGGLDAEGKRWLGCRPGFFLPVRVLSRLFRRLFLEALDKAFQKGELEFHGALTELANADHFRKLLVEARLNDWVVYAKPPFGGPKHVLRYLGRYTHRVAISNHRLLAIQDGKVTFRWRDYAHGNQQRTMTLEAEEFIRRFLLHTLPDGFTRIRYFGLLAPRNRAIDLQLARDLLEATAAPQTGLPSPAAADSVRVPFLADDLPRCPACRQGRMIRVELVEPTPTTHSADPKLDTS